MTPDELDIQRRIDAALLEAKSRFNAIPQQAQKVAIQFMPQADSRVRMYILLGLLVFCILGYWWSHRASVSQTTQREQGLQPTVPVKELSNVPKITLKGKDVVVYQGNGKLKLPFGTPTSSKITASATLKPSDGGYKAVSLYDPKTGQSTILAEEQKRPLFSFGGQTEVGIRAGLTTSGGQEGTVYTRQDILRIGGVYTAVYGEAGINTNITVKPAAKAMVDVSYRW